jgi:hypothetical protein
MDTFHEVMVALATGSLVALVILALLGHCFKLHLPGHRGTASMVAKVLAIVLFLILAFTLFPLLLHLFLVVERGLGNTDVGMVRFLRAHERNVIYTLWGIFIAGLLIALPVMWTDLFGFGKVVPKSQGLIVANTGMPLGETLGRSTFPIPQVTRESLTGSNMSVCQGVFDFEVANGGLRFENCRYCCLEMDHHDDPKIVYINTGISSQRRARSEMAAEHAYVISRLRAAGWLPGHYEYSDTEVIKRRGSPREGDGRYWSKDGVLIIVSEKRMDDPQPNENPNTAGEFIHVIDILPLNDPSYQKLIFESPASREKWLP